MANEDWKRIEDKFRLWSFRVFYSKTFCTVEDPTVRFVKALLASAAPIKDRRLVLDWYAKRRRKPENADA